MKILNSKEAFEAMLTDRNIMCRPIGDMLDFNDLDQFPATIFAKDGYEFCIKIETMELAGITFTKPIKLDEVQVGDDIYIVQACGEIHHYKYVACHEILNQSIARGFAQRDLENAQLQAEAFCKLFDREFRATNVIEIPEQSKKRTRKSKTDECDKIQNTTSNDVEEKTFEQSDVAEIETDPVKLVEKFTAQIQEFTKTDEVLSFRHVFLANGHLDQKDQQHLCKLCEDRLLELDPEQYIPQPEPVVDEASQPSLIDLIEDQAKSAVQDKIYKDAMSGNGQASYPVDTLYNQKKKMLIDRIQEKDSIEALERLAPAIPAAKLNPEDHQELLQIYAERKTAMQHADA